MKNQDDLTQASIQTSVTRSWWELWSPCATFTSPTTLRWSSASLWEGKCKRCCCPTNSLQTYTTNTKEHGLWRSVGQKVSYQSFGPRSKSFIPCFRMGTILWQAWTPHAACPYVCMGMRSPFRGWGRVGWRRWLTSPGALSYAVVTRKIHRIGCGACWRKLVSQLRGRKQHTCTEAPRTRPSTSSFAFYDGHFTGCGWVSGPPAMLMARSTLVALPLFSFLLCSFF